MGIASLIIGIIVLLIALIPLFGGVVFTPAVIGLVLGIVYVSKQSKEKAFKGTGVAGIVLCSISIILIIGYYILFGILAVTDSLSEIGILKNISKQTTLNVGDNFESNGMQITYKSLDKDYKDYMGERKVKDGYKIIKLGIEVKNVGSDYEYISNQDFCCYADDYVCDNIYFETESTLEATLSKGKKAQGYLFFEVPENAQSVTVESNSYGFLPIANKLILVVR